ncbi:hypothetical protein [Bradyrhizobium sp. RDI18]|uniref:hypothetical protein n=1 Tax=Bradyrhizobium sp. RDI18 TaxID=3367400 RepID=UPI0037168277
MGVSRNRGVALTFLDRQEEALASFNAAIALKPDYDRAIAQRDKIPKSERLRRQHHHREDRTSE